MVKSVFLRYNCILIGWKYQFHQFIPWFTSLPQTYSHPEQGHTIWAIYRHMWNITLIYGRIVESRLSCKMTVRESGRKITAFKFIAIFYIVPPDHQPRRGFVLGRVMLLLRLPHLISRNIYWAINLNLKTTS